MNTALSFTVVVVLALGCSPEPEAAARGPRSVLLVCLDTVRADHLGSYGYGARPTTPALDALAASGTRFADVTAASGWTKPSVPSYLTGTPPSVHGVYEGSAWRDGELTSDVLGDEAVTLAERFAEAGYATAAFVRNAQLAPGSGMEQGFDVYVDEAGDAGQIVDAALRWLSEHGDRPFFLYLHILDAHWPYHVPDAAAERFAGVGALERFRSADWKQLREDINDGDVALDDDRLGELLALYDGALSYSDAQLQRLLQALETRGLRDDTVISVVADHGEEFMEHGRVGHGHGLYEALTSVPWILAGPDVPVARIDEPVSLLDLAPTLLGAAGLASERNAGPASTAVDRFASPRRAAPVFAEHKGPDVYMQSLRVGTLKLVRTLRAKPRAETGGDVALAHLAHGGRWEAELSADDSGLVATQLKPRPDDAGDPIELKGPLHERRGDRLRLAHWDAALDEHTEFTGSLRTADDLRPGATLKLSGRFDGALFRVARVKGYDQSLDEPAEIRGPLKLLDDGRVRIGSTELRFDGRTRFKDVPEAPPRATLERDEVALLHERGLAAMVLAGYPAELAVYDLVADPAERHPRVHAAAPDAPLPPAARRMSEQLDALGAQLAASRAWNLSGGRELDDDTIAALRELGYLR